MSNIESNNTHTLPNTCGNSASPPVLQFDAAKYRAEVDLFDITEAQKQELLLTLWSIMRSFVEFGFTVDVCAVLNDTSLIPDDDGLR